MRVVVFALLATVFSTSAVAAPATRPQLAEEPLFSAGQVSDVDPDSGLYTALQSLIERYALDGITYTDKSVRKDLPVTAGEARVALVSGYEQLAMLANASVENELAETSDDDAAKVIAKSKQIFDRILTASPACKLLAGTKYAAATGKTKAKPLAAAAPISWAQALACYPASQNKPTATDPNTAKAVKPAAIMTRGDFLYKLNEALDGAVEEIGG